MRMKSATPSVMSLQFGPRCIWGETRACGRCRHCSRSASIRPQMYLGRDGIGKPVAGCRYPLQFGPRCIWGETASVAFGLSRYSCTLQFGPRCIWGETCQRWKPMQPVDAAGLQFGPRCICGETRPFASSRTGRGRASIRPQMYLGRDAATDLVRLAPEHELQFGPRCIWGETLSQSQATRTESVSLQFGPRCIWGETSYPPSFPNVQPTLQFGPRCIWGETSGGIGAY
ncbi:unnamed protein product [Gemmata massiliana]|uniref:Uncharacterized protein n=1 Tax=Gemmata massiliana TaxID=1210884 RepID=A0A6P2CWT8_9BACT|nr:unnamed protein product [Gemmata massiliana]